MALENGFFDKVQSWRKEELERLFPAMQPEHVAELARNNDKLMLERAAGLAAAGCPTELAYKIVR
jgi:hypothetical protein